MAKPLAALPRVKTVSVLKLAADWKLPFHAHEEINELILILEGGIRTEIRDQVLHGRPGNVLIYPQRVAHREQAVDGTLRMLFVTWNAAKNQALPSDWPVAVTDARGRIRTLLEWLHDHFPTRTPAEELTASALLHSALFEFIELSRNAESDPLARVCRYIKQNFARELELEDLADIAHLSRYHFGRKFQEYTGMSPMKYLRRTRVEAARALLTASPMPLRAVAALVGLVDEFHLSRVFRAELGLAPSSLRDRRQ